jgi:hypothetical protein
MVFLCLAVLLAGLLLTYRSYQPRVGEVVGNSMEPTLQGPRYLVTCGSCQAVIPFTIDAWNPNRPAICPCCGHSILTDDVPPVQRGQTVSYLPARRMRRTSKDSPTEKILRGDIVVLEREAGAVKELKRVVGLPDEEVTLKEGDLWINDRRYEKTLRETLAQSVLVAAWDPRICEGILDEFIESLTLPPTNELAINAHDSHLPIPTYDLGIALRCVAPIRKGQLAMIISDANHRYEVEVLIQDNWNVTCNGLPVPKLSNSQSEVGESLKWIIVAMIDGRMLIGDESGGCFAISLESLRSTNLSSMQEESRQMIRISEAVDIPEIDLALVFRDLVHRGYGDTAEETIPAGPGFVLLGDNVSISDDSRGPAGHSVRWDIARLHGVVLRDVNDLASLLRQAETLRSCGCQTNGKGPP